jgi:hypothetical protein
VTPANSRAPNVRRGRAGRGVSCATIAAPRSKAVLTSSTATLTAACAPRTAVGRMGVTRKRRRTPWSR